MILVFRLHYNSIAILDVNESCDVEVRRACEPLKIIVIVNSRFLQRPQKLFHKCLSKTVDRQRVRSRESVRQDSQTAIVDGVWS